MRNVPPSAAYDEWPEPAGPRARAERTLLEFDKIAGFSDVFFGSSTLEEVEGLTAPVASFDVEIDLGPEIYTGRYLDGLPEGLR